MDHIMPPEQRISTIASIPTLGPSPPSDAKEDIGKLKELVRKNWRLVEALNGQLRAPDVAPDLFHELEQARSEVRRWEAANVQMMKELEKVQSGNLDLKEKLKKEKELNWEMRYKNQDQKGDIEKLEMQLRNSIALDDEQGHPLKAKTALETVQKREIEGLKQRVLDLEKNLWKNAKATSGV